MILDGINNIDLGVGADRRIMEPGDAQLSVPSVIMPVVLSLQRHVENAPSNSPIKNSSFTVSQISRTNQAALNQTVLTLAAGLWELELTIASWFNYSNTAGAINGVRIQIQTAIFIVPVLTRLALINQSFTDFNRMRLLMDKQFAIVHSVDVTGVGQSVDTQMTVNAIRIL